MQTPNANDEAAAAIAFDTAMTGRRASGPLRTLIATLAMGLAFVAVGAQLVRLAIRGQGGMSVSINETVAQSFARPDIVDRNGRLLATDVEAYSLFADPQRVIDRDEVIEKLGAVFTDIDRTALRRDLSDRNRRFVWLRRGLSPRVAQQVHNLGLPGLDFRRELRRAYPAGNIAGHTIGYVNIDNKGVAGIERYVDEVVGVDAVHTATIADRPPVRLSIDVGVQHAVEAELADAIERYKAKGAAALVMDVNTGELLASASLPTVDPARPGTSLDTAFADKISSGTFELGSVFKTLTVAMALDQQLVTPDTVIDVGREMKTGRFTIKDVHSTGRPLSVAEIFLRSSNVGSAKLALQAGPKRQQEFLQHMSLLEGMKTEAGPVPPPQVPKRWGEVETVTVSYGHGIAMAPLQFAGAVATLINGGRKVVPTLVKRNPGADDAQAAPQQQLISPATSAAMRTLMRGNVSGPVGTGKRANVPGYDVGGKTGTAELPGPGGYREKAVISSFIGAFPMEAPQYVVFVLLFEPKGTAETGNEILASRNAAPTMARVVSRIGPLLGILPKQSASADRVPGSSGQGNGSLALRSRLAFDAATVAKYETR
ncbi:Cell division protein FtsI [Peptidoglycan synthetase] [Hyphomicrobium sulfonivorans]|uniref:Cell division protein FtsI [Peptidoglycan synthetase] n=1 Tax=Hyphomicrobium sulfonivorans TaxID=121290 RepID=A0A109B906_HYPSL|nr:penicillin-binding protein 2 [Hyphomicrobium sulfonivorans]KWT64299.1 Cell division protein FtsI [Peptidoglycan synthetase] [Hyphomicrobium sulfonivorans]